MIEKIKNKTHLKDMTLKLPLMQNRTVHYIIVYLYIQCTNSNCSFINIY